MSYFQATTHKPHSALIAYRPVAGLGKARELLHRDSLCPHSTRSCKLQQQVYPRLVLVSSCYKKLGPVYALSGKENPEVMNDPFSMESLNKAMAEAKKQRPIKDLLMEQIAKLRGQGPGGNGGNRNRYGGGGGSDGSDDESFKESFYELIQILLATVAFIFLYIHIIRGEELYRLARDYTRYLVTDQLILNPRGGNIPRSFFIVWRNFAGAICAPMPRNLRVLLLQGCVDL
ncbi:hypothetical protein QOZ80_4AG0312410 [Eleusine coracana subsp. coracana]|nr:hypothetical protein QOZ80_4AG0312410 [Eleusine coracana subsp. coracana]